MARFPGNKQFAFTVLDDTDRGTVDNLDPIYRFLLELGFLTTKSVWSLGPIQDGHVGGESLQNRAYLRFILWLKSQGFEVSLHNVQNHHAAREVTYKGIETYRSLIGEYPRIHCNHSRNHENLYWGDQRFSLSTIRWAYNLVSRFRWRKYFTGHIEGSPYFWGDICKTRIDYVRNFSFDEINLNRVNPTMPYHDPLKAYVNAWFSSCDGSNVDSFCRLLCETNQDRLEEEGGVCIMYTHFACGFCNDGVLHPEFVRTMKRLSRRNGWFVPVSSLLDHLRATRMGDDNISKAELASMERRWFMAKLARAVDGVH
jgi:hypothetical protein